MRRALIAGVVLAVLGSFIYLVGIWRFDSITTIDQQFYANPPATKVSLVRLLDAEHGKRFGELTLSLQNPTSGLLGASFANIIEVEGTVIDKAAVQECTSTFSELPDSSFTDRFIEISQDGVIGIVRLQKDNTLFDGLKSGDRIVVRGRWRDTYQCANHSLSLNTVCQDIKASFDAVCRQFQLNKTVPEVSALSNRYSQSLWNLSPIEIVQKTL